MSILSVNYIMRRRLTYKAANQQFLPSQSLDQGNTCYGGEQVDPIRNQDQPDSVFCRKAGHLENCCAVVAVIGVNDYIHKLKMYYL